MGKMIKKGECCCGCTSRMVLETNDGRIFFVQRGLGYVQYDPKADYMLRIWDEYLPDYGNELYGETPVDYALSKAILSHQMKSEGYVSPRDIEDLVEQLHVPFMS